MHQGARHLTLQTPHGYIRGFVNCPRVRGGCCKPIQGLTSLSQGVQLGYNPTGYRAILGAKIEAPSDACPSLKHCERWLKVLRGRDGADDFRQPLHKFDEGHLTYARVRTAPFLQLPKRETAFLSFPRKGFLPASSHFSLPVAGSQGYPKWRLLMISQYLSIP